ncbi:hypothetical protein RhiJN_12295 [Ceratobasidium sp. AG-Ba]|nr:hypothetical protein RhiJN_12295 [Ceratobasidium sp. AG-Ba]QRW12908.1 hypothetical protein RhiLY_11907 [Ceratobasidium sp. AG-Ba]
MDCFTSRILVLLLLVNTALGSTIVAAHTSAIAFENGPSSAWECQTAQGKIQIIQPAPILRAINELVYHWDHKSHKRWPVDKNPYPRRLSTNEITYWPDSESTEHLDDSQWLCNLNSWVGSYPALGNNSDESDPGPFRVLVSSSYKKEGTGADVTYVFGFCGVAIRVGNEHEMCWPIEMNDNEQEFLD